MQAESLRSWVFLSAWLHQWVHDPPTPKSTSPWGHNVAYGPCERSHQQSMLIHREESDPRRRVGICRQAGFHEENKQNSLGWTVKHLRPGFSFLFNLLFLLPPLRKVAGCCELLASLYDTGGTEGHRVTPSVGRERTTAGWWHIAERSRVSAETHNYLSLLYDHMTLRIFI